MQAPRQQLVMILVTCGVGVSPLAATEQIFLNFFTFSFFLFLFTPGQFL